MASLGHRPTTRLVLDFFRVDDQFDAMVALAAGLRGIGDDWMIAAMSHDE